MTVGRLKSTIGGYQLITLIFTRNARPIRYRDRASRVPQRLFLRRASPVASRRPASACAARGSAPRTCRGRAIFGPTRFAHSPIRQLSYPRSRSRSIRPGRFYSNGARPSTPILWLNVCCLLALGPNFIARTAIESRITGLGGERSTVSASGFF